MDKIKLIIFDLDGVLVDTKSIHFDALNFALQNIDKKYIITIEENNNLFEGLKTYDKLNLLTELKNLPLKYHKNIFKQKQKQTIKYFKKIGKNVDNINMLKSLKKMGYLLACGTNSNKKISSNLLNKLKIKKYFDYILTGDDVKNHKPHPEIYWSIMTHFKSLPEETLIIEDSPQGLLAANRSGSTVIKINKPTDLSLELILNELKNV